MITQTWDRANFIGGSEMAYMYSSYHTDTFRTWWQSKLEGIPLETPSNPSMAVGTILEHDVISLYEQINGVEGVRDYSETKGIARANTDYILNDKVSDVKVSSKAFEWFLKGNVPIQYRRQLLHYCYVLGLSKASVIAYQTTEELMKDPFQELNPHLLYEIEVEITDEDIRSHQEKLDYLEHCRDMNIYPGEE